MGYPVGLVGESHYQLEICACQIGAPIRIAHQVNNDYDERALVALALDKFTIGYIPKGHWLMEAVHDEGQSCRAEVSSIDRNEAGFCGVVLDVTLEPGPIECVEIRHGYPEVAR